MKLSMVTRKASKCYHLRGVSRVYPDKNTISCLDGKRYHEIYEQTRSKNNARVEFEIPVDEKMKAYYLCGKKRSPSYDEIVGVAFVPCEGQKVQINNSILKLEITDAREVKFQKNGLLSQSFARHIKEGKPL